MIKYIHREKWQSLLLFFLLLLHQTSFLKQKEKATQGLQVCMKLVFSYIARGTVILESPSGKEIVQYRESLRNVYTFRSKILTSGNIF